MKKNITPHSFRRTFTTNCHRQGMKIMEIMKRMGHSKITTTRRYIQLNCDEKYNNLLKRISSLEKLQNSKMSKKLL